MTVDPHEVQQETMIAMLERERRSLTSSILALVLLAVGFGFYSFPEPFYALLALRFVSFLFTRRAARNLANAVRKSRPTKGPHRLMVLGMALTGLSLALLLLPAPSGTPFAAVLLVNCVVLVTLTLVPVTLAAMRGPRDAMLASFFLTICGQVAFQPTFANPWVIAVAALTAIGIRMYAYNTGEHIVTAAAVLVENRQLSEDLSDALAHAEYLGVRDPLTGLYNRRKLFEERDDGQEGQLRQVLMIDLDRFKSINDRFGHAAGDRVLVATASAIRNCLERMDGTSDLAFRLGGEEFVAILDSEDFEKARSIAEELRRDIARIALDESHTGSFETSASIGLASWHPGEKLDDVLHRADAACYKAKNEGRNRVRSAA